MKNTLNIRQNDGYTLFVGMILLTVLSTMGISAMKDTLLEEKMAFNFQDKHTAFQATESALVFVERALMRGQSVPGIEQESGYTDKSSLAGDLDWTSATAIPLKDWESENANGSEDLYQDPLVKIQFLHAVDSKKTGQDPQPNKEIDLLYYRVSARAQGLTNSSLAVTQSVLER